MKKLLALLFVTLFLFTSCKEEVKPKEVEENTEVEEIILPEPDENTKVIEISFPEDFYEYEYTEPELVSPEEFEWGDYVPFVRFARYCIGDNAPGPFFEYSFLSEGINTLEEGAELYKKLNEKYLISNYSPEDVIIWGKSAKEMGVFDAFIDSFFNSHIAYISSDFSKMLRVSYLKENPSSVKEVSDIDYCLNWKQVCETFIDGKITSVQENEDTIVHSLDGVFSDYLSNSNDAKYIPDWKKELEEKGISVTDIGENYAYAVVSSSEEKETVNIYDIPKKKVLYTITLPKKYVSEKFSYDVILKNFSKNKLILMFASQSQDYFCVYDCINEKFSFVVLQNYSTVIRNIFLSPDGKYIIYKKNIKGTQEDDDTLICKICIHNVQKNEATYYDYELSSELDINKGFIFAKHYFYNIINWVNKYKLLEEIQQ